MVTAQAEILEPKSRKWTVEEYYRMAEIGFFNGKRVELIEGVVFEAAPLSSIEATAMTLARDIMKEAFGDDWVVRPRFPLTLSEISEPEPDIAVVPGKARDYKDAHPTTAALVVEISNSSLAYHRRKKAGLYAKSGIQDYWIVNLDKRQVKVHRRPITDATAKYIYGDRMIVTEQDSIAPLAKPKATIAVADLLP